MDSIILKIKRLTENFDDVPLPDYATEGSAGMDIRAAVEEDMTLEPGKVIAVPTNLSLEIPAGYEVQVRPRSGLALKHSLGILNSPGTIDSDYRGEVKIIMMNFGQEKYVVKRGERIAQLVISKVIKANLIESVELTESNRGTGGFGHTGKN